MPLFAVIVSFLFAVYFLYGIYVSTATHLSHIMLTLGEYFSYVHKLGLISIILISTDLFV